MRKIASKDNKTIKYIFDVEEHTIESCLLKLEKYGTVVCVSSQIGCSQNCRFCASGRKRFVRNLSFEEIIFQVVQIMKDEPKYFEDSFQITYMGSGEPFSNQENVLNSIDFFLNEYSNLSRINISTMLPHLNIDTDCLAKYKNRLHIQYSLHFTDDKVRRRYFNNDCLPTIEQSIRLCDEISKIIIDKYAINYILIDNVNDSVEAANQLVEVVKNSNGYLKISELCSIVNSKFNPSSNSNDFIDVLSRSGIYFETFKSDGKDVNAGCGQFYNDSVI